MAAPTRRFDRAAFTWNTTVFTATSPCPLIKLLEDAGAGGELTRALLVSAPDGYRALFSFGELQLADKGRRIILAGSVDGKQLEGQRGGKFRIIVPDELVDDRDVMAVSRIEVVDLKL